MTSSNLITFSLCLYYKLTSRYISTQELMIKDYYFQEYWRSIMSGFSCCTELLHCSKIKTVAFLVPLNYTQKVQPSAGNLQWRYGVSMGLCGVQKAGVWFWKAVAVGSWQLASSRSGLCGNKRVEPRMSAEMQKKVLNICGGVRLWMGATKAGDYLSTCYNSTTHTASGNGLPQGTSDHRTKAGSPTHPCRSSVRVN